MVKCRGCGTGGAEYESKGLGAMHYDCEIERLTENLEEQLGVAASLDEDLQKLRAAGTVMRAVASNISMALWAATDDSEERRNVVSVCTEALKTWDDVVREVV